MSTPAPTPAEKALRRVLKISGFDALSLLIVAGLSVMVTLVLGSLSGTATGLLIALGGVIELRGRRRLQRGDPAGLRQLIRSQLLVLAVILVYCVTQLGSFDSGYITDQAVPQARQLFELGGLSFDDYLKSMELTVNDLVPLVRLVFLAVYGTFAVVSCVYQGGMVLYYRGKTALVEEALAAPPKAG